MDDFHNHEWWPEWSSLPLTQIPLPGTRDEILEEFAEAQGTGFENLLRGEMAVLNFRVGVQSTWQQQPGPQAHPQTGQQQLQGPNIIPRQNIDLGSMGTQFLNDWDFDVQNYFAEPPPPFESFNLVQPAPNNSWDSVPLDPGMLPSSQDMTNLTLAFGLQDMELDLNLVATEANTTPSSMAVEPMSSPSASAASGQPTPMSTRSPEPRPELLTNSPQGSSAQSVSWTETELKPMRAFPCPFLSCDRTFSRKFELNKHEKTHTRPFLCPVLYCDERSAEKKGIQRHLWTVHKDYAKREGIPCEEDICPFPGCGHRARKDNLKRHVRLKHA